MIDWYQAEMAWPIERGGQPPGTRERQKVQIRSMTDKTKATMDSSWLRLGALRDEGSRTAVYPYFKLKNILTPEDCRPAALEETEALEREFGRAIADPIYRLLWVLNTAKGVCTSHTTISPANWKSPFDWARHYVGSAIITLPRDSAEQHDRRVAAELVQELGQTLAVSRFLHRHNTTGWFVIICPVTINFGYETEITMPDGATQKGVRDWPGYGCELIISGSASSRAKAGERWSGCVSFVADTLHDLQTKNAIPADPYNHFAAFER